MTVSSTIKLSCNSTTRNAGREQQSKAGSLTDPAFFHFRVRAGPVQRWDLVTPRRVSWRRAAYFRSLPLRNTLGRSTRHTNLRKGFRANDMPARLRPHSAQVVWYQENPAPHPGHDQRECCAACQAFAPSCRIVSRLAAASRMCGNSLDTDCHFLYSLQG